MPSRSSVLPEMNTESIEISTEPINTPHLASSTVLSDEVESPPLSSVFSKLSSSSIPAEQLSPEVFLTPPPPTHSQSLKLCLHQSAREEDPMK